MLWLVDGFLLKLHSPTEKIFFGGGQVDYTPGFPRASPPRLLSATRQRRSPTVLVFPRLYARISGYSAPRLLVESIFYFLLHTKTLHDMYTFT